MYVIKGYRISVGLFAFRYTHLTGSGYLIDISFFFNTRIRFVMRSKSKCKNSGGSKSP